MIAPPRSNFDAARTFAEFGLAKRQAGERESASGPGSTREAAGPALDMLRRTIFEHDIRSVLDLGCGDWNWMRHAGLPDLGRGLSVSYTGWEATPNLVDELTVRFGQDHVRFELMDVTTAEIPEVDLVIARDIFFHISIENTVAVLEKVRRKALYLISTSFLDEAENVGPQNYLPIDNWGFYRINLNAAPFSMLSAMIESTDEPLGAHKKQPRSICLYQLSQSV